MLSGVLPWFAIILVFGVVIFVHELGHFLAAKATGVYAPRFSIGFGPAIWSRKWGETEYVLASIPLGGYVRMASRDDSSMAILEGGTEQPAPENPTEGEALPRWYDPQGMAPFGPKPIPENRLFESKSLPARLVIMGKAAARSESIRRHFSRSLVSPARPGAAPPVRAGGGRGRRPSRKPS